MTTTPDLSESDVSALISAALARAGSLKALASEWSVSDSYLSDVIKGRRAPGGKILRRLGLARVIRYAPVADAASIPPTASPRVR